MITTTTGSLPEKRIVRTLGLVRGNTIRARHLGLSGSVIDCRKCHDPHVSDIETLMQANRHDPFADDDCAVCHPSSEED